MINNRQNGRRRGRGGGPGAPRPNGSNGGGQDRGNRIDNRARGNAAQLLEKYKALARDAQMQGDRVNTEYYLQFADHYFRVLSESRSRFEEQQPRPRRDDFSQQSDEDYGDEGDRIGDDQQAPEPAYEPREPRGQDMRDRQPRDDRGDYRRSRDEQPRDREPRADREPRVEREPRMDREPRVERERQPRAARERAVEEAPVDQAPIEQAEERRPRRGRPPRAERAAEEAAAPAPVEQPVLFDAPAEEPSPARRRGRPPKAQAAEQIEVDRLPPSLSLSASAGNDANDGEEPAERPRRTRKPRGESAAA